jgi:nitrite reductase (NADH) small subunit
VNVVGGDQFSGRADVGAVDEFEDAQPRAVIVDGRAILVVRWRDEFYAVRDTCPHMGVRLSAGNVRAVTSEGEDPGRIVADGTRPLIVCPWHGWQFHLEDGVCATRSERLRVKAYAVVVEDERVLVKT